MPSSFTWRTTPLSLFFLSPLLSSNKIKKRKEKAAYSMKVFNRMLNQQSFKYMQVFNHMLNIASVDEDYLKYSCKQFLLYFILLCLVLEFIFDLLNHPQVTYT